MDKELNLIFYGNTFIPLSVECHWCHHFNYECGGSVYAGNCGTGQVKYLKPSRVAGELLEKIDNNHFVLARVCGYDMASQDMLDHISELKEKIKNSTNKAYIDALKKAIANYEIALNKADTEIEELNREYNTETVFYSAVEESETLEEPISDASTEVDVSIRPKNTDADDVTDDGALPF